MQQKAGGIRGVLEACGLVALGFVMVGCPQPIEPSAPDNGVVMVDPPPVGTPNDTDPPLNPSPIVQEADCSAWQLPAGAVVDCTALLGTQDAYCATVWSNPLQPNYELLASCGTCDTNLIQPPAGVDCVSGDIIDPLPSAQLLDSTCKTCHAPNEYDGANSIEDPHPWSTVQCVGCHGGNGESTNPVFAHVCTPPEIGSRQQQVLDTRAFFLNFTTAGLQFLPDYDCSLQGGGSRLVSPLEYLAFINPGDLRAGRAGKGCGTCHGPSAIGTDIPGGDIVTKVSRSTMGNATGLHSGTRHGIGAANAFADRNAQDGDHDFNTMGDFGAVDITNPSYDPNTRVVGEVPSLRQATVVAGAQFLNNQTYTADAINNSYALIDTESDNYPNGIANSVAEQLFQEVLNQACTGCHLHNKYNNNRAGDYRSAGCTACHFETGLSGRSSSLDPNVRKYEPINPDALAPGERPHIADHRIRSVAKFPSGALAKVTKGIADRNCIICHMGSNRTVAQYQGYRLDQNQDLTEGIFYPSQNDVTFTYRNDLFGENATFNNRVLQQWIDSEVWQADVTNQFGTGGQDETPADVHHEAGMGCIDCHGTGATHGRGRIYSRMKLATHENDLLCETCHGTIDDYADNNGTNLIDRGGYAIANTVVNDGATGEFWLVSRLNGSQHYIPQVKDAVNANNAGGFGKRYPTGAAKEGQPVFNYVASAAMGRYQISQDLADGYGPMQLNNANAQVRNNFSHSDGYQYAQGVGSANQGLECYSCHAAWQNNCIGCHLDAFYDDNANNYFYSQITGERIYLNFNANFVYQNPVNFMLGINDRTKITPFQGMHRFFSYTDLNGNQSDRVSYADRNGLGNDPQLESGVRNALPALQNQPFTPHSIRNRYSNSEIGMKGCLDCHFGNGNGTFMWDQDSNVWQNQAPYDVTAVVADYANAIEFNVNQAYGYGTNLWLFDADGEPVVDSNNAPAFDLDNIVEGATGDANNRGVSNSSSNHPLLDPFGLYSNPDYREIQSTDTAAVARPLTGTILDRMDKINIQWGGLSDIYYYNSIVGQDPNDTGNFVYWLNDYNYVGQ